MPSTTFENRGGFSGPSRAPGPLAKLLGRALRSLPSPHQNGPLHPLLHVIANAGKSQTAFKPTDFPNESMRNLATNYGTRTIDYRTAPTPKPKNATTLAKLTSTPITPSSRVTNLAQSDLHDIDIARHINMANQAKSLLSKRVTVKPQPINNTGAGAGTTNVGGITLPHAPVGRTTGGSATGIDPSLLTQAQETISAQMDPQLADYQNQINNAVTGGQQQSNDLAELYRRLGVQTSAGKSAGDVANADALSSIGGNYDKLDASLKQIFGNAAGATGNELQRLGIQAVAPEALAGQARDSNYAQGLAGLDRANALSNSTSKGQSFDNLMTVLQSQGQLSGADKTANAMALARQTITDLSNKKGALAATRKAAVDALYKSLSTAKTQAQKDAAQQNFMNQIAMGKLGISQGQLGVAQGKLAQSGSLLPYTMNLKTAQTAAALHSANAPYKTTGGTAAADLKGYGGALKLLSSVKTNAASKGALGTAMNLFKFYQTKYGANAFNKMMTTNKGGDPHYNALPADLRGALMDAFTVAQKK